MNSTILYSFRRCPYAIRARWAILNCGITVILREVSLKNKPVELTNISPKSTVPVLITSDGRVIDESIKIIEWAINNKNKSFKGNLLKSKENKIIDQLISQNDNTFKYHLDRYKYPNRFDNMDVREHHQQAMDVREHHQQAYEILIGWDNLIKKSINKYNAIWIGGANETIADWSLWPFVRQYRLIDKERFDKDKYLTNLKKWINYYLNHHLYESLMRKYSFWSKTSEVIFFPK